MHLYHFNLHNEMNSEIILLRSFLKDLDLNSPTNFIESTENTSTFSERLRRTKISSLGFVLYSSPYKLLMVHTSKWKTTS